MDFRSEDPIHNAIHFGIKRGIEVAWDNKCYGSCLILMYSAIDTMAYIAMPEKQLDVMGADFIKWVERYIRFDGPEQLTGLELWGARCAMVHHFGVDSKLFREGKVRRIGYCDAGPLPIRFAPEVDPNFAILSIGHLWSTLSRAIDTFLVDVFKDPITAPIAERRIAALVNELPVRPPQTP